MWNFQSFLPHGDQGMNILFVPFLTDTQNGYTRVKHCAQARAIENECYVAFVVLVTYQKSTIWIFSMHKRFTLRLILHSKQWNQSRSNPNTEMTLIVDVDINLLKALRTRQRQHHEGSQT
jgi:predicted amidohydrolase